MQRRKFIIRGAQAGLALSALGLYACKQTENPKDTSSSSEPLASANPLFAFSLAQWSVHRMIASGELSPMDFAAKARSWGFTGLEYVNHLYASEIAKYGDDPKAIEKTMKEVLQRSKDQGMSNQIMMVDLQPEAGALASPDATLRNLNIESHLPWLDATALLGCHSMRVNLFGTTDEAQWKEAAVEGLGKLSELAAERGVNVIVENHGYLSSNAALLADVMKTLNLSNCGTLPDFGNFCLKREGGQLWQAPCVEEYDMYKGVEELLPFAKGVSAKSYDFNENGEETKIDYQRMLQLVKNSGYRGFIGVEYEGERLSEEQGILATKTLLEKTISSLS